MTSWKIPGACDCHSHVFGPFGQFPLSMQRTFDPPESPIEQLEAQWKALGIERAVLVQGSAHGDDPSALLAAIARDPERRRGVVLLKSDVSAEALAELHRDGVRAVRFNWIRHLLAKDERTEAERLRDAATLLDKVAALGWHVELHLDVADLRLVQRLHVPAGMNVVIDHIARLDASSANLQAEERALLQVLEQDGFWVKLSGADRVAAQCEDLNAAVATVRRIAQAAPQRCVWGLDWPHVNLARKRSDGDLVDTLAEAIGDEARLAKILVTNPEALYGFAPIV